MGWRKLFGAKKSGAEDRKPDATAELLPFFPFNGRIRQHAYTRMTGDVIHEHLFLNPDTSSCVAAVMVTKHDRAPLLTIDLIPREDGEQIGRALKPLELGGMSCGIVETTAEGLKQLGVAHPPTYSVAILQSYLTQAALAANQLNTRHVLGQLEHSNLLSKYPAVREAMVDAICQHFVSFDVNRDFHSSPRRGRA